MNKLNHTSMVSDLIDLLWYRREYLEGMRDCSLGQRRGDSLTQDTPYKDGLHRTRWDTVLKSRVKQQEAYREGYAVYAANKYLLNADQEEK